MNEYLYQKAPGTGTRNTDEPFSWRAEVPAHRASQWERDHESVPVEEGAPFLPIICPVTGATSPMWMGVLGRWKCPQHLSAQGAEGPASTRDSGSLCGVSVQPAHDHCPLSLQVHFVAAIDVYEDGEAGLLLCYNCK